MKIILDDWTPILAVRHRPGEPLGEFQVLVSAHRKPLNHEEVTAVELNAELARVSARRLTVWPLLAQDGRWFCPEWAEDEAWEVVWFHRFTTPVLEELNEGMEAFRAAQFLG